MAMICTGRTTWWSSLAACLIVGSLCWPSLLSAQKAEIVEGNYDELPRDQIEEVTKCQAAFREIQTTVGQEKNNFNPELCMKTAKAMQKKDWSFRLFNGKLNEALKIFISLPLVTDAEFCNYDGYEILAKNFLLNTQSAHLTFTSSMLYHYARQHAQICLPLYAEKFKEERDAVGISKELNNYFRNLDLDDFSRDVPEVTGSLTDLVVPFVDANLGSFDIRVDGLRKILTNMRSALGLSKKNHSNTIRTIIRSDLLAHCSAYVETMREIFAPAKIDLFMARAGSQKIAMPQFDQEFIDGWRNYRICLYLDRADRSDIVSRFIKALEVNA